VVKMEMCIIHGSINCTYNRIPNYGCTPYIRAHYTRSFAAINKVEWKGADVGEEESAM